MTAPPGAAPARFHSAQTDHLVTALRGIFGDRLRSVVAYGLDTGESVASLVLVSSLTMGDLDACAARAHGWKRDGVATPLLLPEEEFRRSLDAFPLEYCEIVRAHEVLFGASPFDDATIERGDLRRACETQIKSHLVHLREGFIEAAGTPRAIADLVTASAAAFGALLRNIARLNGSVSRDRAIATRDGARTGLTATDAARLFPAYLAAVEQLARYVDAWDV
jgi:hypothetical protein